MPELYKRNPNANCDICGRSVYRRPIEIERNKGRAFCSAACYGVSCRREVSCLMCGVPILAGLNKKTCSRTCANKHRTGIKYRLNRPKDKVVAEHAIKIRLLRVRGM